MHRSRRPGPLAALLILTLLPGLAARADDVKLKASVRLPAATDVVRLGDVAELTGDEAQRYADLVIAEVPADGNVVEIPLARVRAALDEAGVHWGRVNLSGRATIVRPRRRGAAAPVAMTGASLDGRRTEARKVAPPEVETLGAAALVDEPSLRGALARAMTAGLGVTPADLRLGFDPADREILTALRSGVQFELTPEDSLTSERVTFVSRAWSEGRVLATRRVALRPLVRTPSAVLRRELRRGETVGPSDFDVTPQWLAPGPAALVSPPSAVSGRLATKRLPAGETLRRRSLQAPVLVERGDRVVVRCLVGGVVLTLQAEARGDGAAGDRIEVRKLGERATFLATVTGRGEAVVDLARRPGADPASPRRRDIS